MIYKLFAFFTTLPVNADKAMFEMTIRALDNMNRNERIAIRDAALHFAKTVENTL